MTTEEKAKAYDQALERARKLKEMYPQDAPGYIEVFPELIESEDERMFNLIKEIVITYFFDCEHNFSSSDRERVLAWLEKQKERGPLTKEEEYTLYRIIEYFEDEDEHPEWVELLRNIYNLPYVKQKEQKPAAWGEEDEKMRRLLIAIMEKNPKGTVYSTGEFAQALKKGCVSVDEISGWLKSIRPSWKPSEEQIKVHY